MQANASGSERDGGGVAAPGQCIPPPDGCGDDGAVLASVLIVENDPDSRDALETLFQLAEMAVEVTESAQSALDLLVAGARPNAIVLDVWTSGLTAAEFLRRKASAGPAVAGVPVIAVSGDERTLESLAAEFAGARLVATLRKPFDIDELVEIVLREVSPAA